MAIRHSKFVPIVHVTHNVSEWVPVSQLAANWMNELTTTWSTTTTSSSSSCFNWHTRVRRSRVDTIEMLSPCASHVVHQRCRAARPRDASNSMMTAASSSSIAVICTAVIHIIIVNCTHPQSTSHPTSPHCTTRASPSPESSASPDINNKASDTVGRREGRGRERERGVDDRSYRGSDVCVCSRLIVSCIHPLIVILLTICARVLYDTACGLSYLHCTTGCANKNNSLEKKLYFSKGCTKLSQTFRIWIWVFSQHIMLILLKQLIWFNRYSSLNIKIKFCKWTCRCIEYSRTRNQTLHSISPTIQTVCDWRMSTACSLPFLAWLLVSREYSRQ